MTTERWAGYGRFSTDDQNDRSNEDQRRVIRRSIEQGSAAELAAVTAAIESTGGLAYTARLARQEAALAVEALAELPESAYKQALRELADFAVERNY